MEERRASPRCRPCKTILGRILVTPTDESLATILQDVSFGGLGLLVRSAVAPDSLLCVEVGPADPFLAQVKHATVQPDGTWVVGCRFLEVPDPTTLGSLLP